MCALSVVDCKSLKISIMIEYMNIQTILIGIMLYFILNLFENYTTVTLIWVRKMTWSHF